MIVISDTTPILSLLKSNQLVLLKKLYGSVIVPDVVENNSPLGFIGLREDMIEMLFVDDNCRGRGFGSALVEFDFTQFFSKFLL